VLRSDEHLEFVSTRARSLLTASTDDDLNEQWRQIRRQLEPALQEVRVTNGGPVEVQLRGTGSFASDLRVQVHLVEEPECVCYLLLFQNAARAEAVDRSMRHAVRNRSLRSLAQDTAHNLKDVLNVIAMNLELLSRIAANGALDPAQTRSADRSAEVVSRELRRLDRSLDALLDRDLVEHEFPRRFDLKALLSSLLDLIAARAARQQVDVRSTMSEGTADIWGFPDRVHGALLSLMINALDAMPNGGTLNVSVTKASTIQVRVSDSGPGIATDQLQVLWRAHFTTKPMGTGLGLYLARSTIEAHGGTIGYLPNPGRGSCFVIELPEAASK
jgi:two-component system, NtrC family, sensor histidine kinase HydH